MENKKTLIFLISAVSLGVCAFILFVLFSPISPKDTGIGKAEFTGILVDDNAKRAPEFTGKDSILTPVIENIGEAIASAYENDGQNIDINENQEPYSIPSATSYGSVNVASKTYTEQEIFEFGYNKGHKEFLESLRIKMVQYGYISESEQYPITNMKEAIVLQDRYADFIENMLKNAAGGQTANINLATYRHAYRDLLPMLWEREMRMRDQSANAQWPTNIIYKYREIATRKEIEGVGTAYKKRALSYLIPAANAQVGTSPLACYREGVNNLIRGSQRSAPCCNCGLYCSTGCSFVNDCGPGGGSCNVQLGCLNNACANLPAIWDPMTNICGCYI